MQVVVRADGQDRDVDVVVRTPEATLGDLVRAVLGREPDGPVRVAGRRWPAACPLAEAGVADGALVELGGFVPPPAPDAAPYEVVAVAGLTAGRRWPLGDGTVGRGAGSAVALDEPAVSRQHCTLSLTGTTDAPRLAVTDTGARNAVLVDDRVLRTGERVVAELPALVRLGPVDLQVRARRDDDRPAAPAAGGAFNRPPRPAAAAGPEPLALPREPAERPAEPFGVAALVGPLVLAGVMVAVTHDPRFALFSALSPVLGLGTWWESRRRRGRGAGRDRARWRADLDALAGALREAGERERDRLRDVAPDPAEVLRRAALPSTRLWERRSGAPDALLLSVGTADQAWHPPQVTGPAPPTAVRDVLAGARLLAAPVVVDLSAGGVLGVVGDRAAALAVARALVCAAAGSCGPADLTLAVFTDPGREPDWDWAKWLPHTRAATAGAQRWLSADRADSEALLRALLGGGASGTALVVLDSAVLTRGRGAPARELLSFAAGTGGPAVAGLVVAATSDALPAACDQVLAVRADGSAVLSRLRSGDRVDGVLAAGLALPAALACARDLARFEDPELAVPGAALPAAVRLLPLLELGTGAGGEVDVAAVRERWRSGGPDPGAATPLGVTEHGLFVLDLVRDGAHGLVGGTTGAGKSELLQSLVAGLAVSADPEHLTFVLVDYKGGAAFDACARLPHVVGLVTDLDEQLGARALRALEAELQARERVLRAAGADSLADHLSRGPAEPLPRLVVVVDEFAALARELPDFVGSLVGIAQRGRTLGVHLLLATQRPSGVVDDNIRANTNLRVALRVQDAADSTDVIGTPAAAALRRDRPGRAYVRLGPGEVVPIQTALVTCASQAGADGPVGAAPFGFGPGDGRADTGATAPAPDGGSDLARLVDAVVAAAEQEGLRPPRRPWPEPLPARVDLAPLVAAAADPMTAVVALADDPAGQRQVGAGWDLRRGGLLLLGGPGSGTTTALCSLALSLAARWSPAELELYALDLGAGGLASLEELPHTGSVVAATDRERQVRLLRRLGAELDRRRALPPGTPVRRTVLLVDGLGSLRAAYDDLDGLALVDLLARLHAEGPAVGLSVALSADRPSAVPGALAAVTTQRWLFGLADPGEAALAGLTRAELPSPVPGRAVLLPSRLQAQVGLAPAGAATRVTARWSGVPRAATPVGVLPARLAYGGLGPRGRRDGEVLHLPVGVAESDLGPAELALHDGDGALVAGPARSGRSTVLAALAEAGRDAGLRVVGAGSRRSPLAGCAALDRWLPLAGPDPGAAAHVLAGQLAAPAAPAGLLLLVDDAETLDDPEGALQAALSRTPPGSHVVVAARSDALRTAYGHWTARLRRSRTGLLLRPDVDLDGDLLGVVLPRRAPVPPAVARGYLVADGAVELVQAAGPSAA